MSTDTTRSDGSSNDDFTFKFTESGGMTPRYLMNLSILKQTHLLLLPILAGAIYPINLSITLRKKS